MSNGALSLTVPAGQSHDAWAPNESLRVLQAGVVGDVELEVRFASVPSTRYQTQGLLVEEDPGHYVRFDIHHDGKRLRAYAASIADGGGSQRIDVPVSGSGPAVSLRVTRAGDDWTLRYSWDGASWTVAGTFTHALSVTAAGPFAGNYDRSGRNADAFTALVDAFVDLADPLDPEPTPTPTPTPEPTPTPTDPEAGTQLVPDDFAGANLDRTRWVYDDPLADGGLEMTGAGDGRLRLSVPAGTSHTAGIESRVPRVVQAVGDEDLDIAVKFDTLPQERYQIQGLVIEEDAQRRIRVEFHHNGSSVRTYAATVEDGTHTAVISTTGPAGTPNYLRVRRSGDTWTVLRSTDGASWTVAGDFTHALRVSAVGPFVGNYGIGGAAPAYTAVIDEVRNVGTGAPFPPTGADTTGPFVYRSAFSPADTSVGVSWKTDEPATAVLRYGLTEDASGGVVSRPDAAYGHTAVIGGLEPGTTYYARLSTRDAAGNTSESGPFQVTTLTDAQGLGIDVWYGPEQAAGPLGEHQRWVNVLGSVAGPNDVTALTYRLNGGPAQSLGIGPDTRRLQHAGDFAVEIDRDALLAGPNTVVITATDSAGATATSTVTIERGEATSPPLPLTVDWTDVGELSGATTVVDGWWELDGGALRSTAMGYDRLAAFGDMAWTDYEATTTVTVHALDPDGWQYPSNGAAVGFVLRWRGHVDWDGSQPRWGYYPLGALPIYRWASSYERFEIQGNNNSGRSPSQIVADDSGRTLELGRAYVFKARVETLPGGAGSRYSLKVWPQGAAEPGPWDLVMDQSAADDLASGSLLLLAHHVDASFGPMTITPP